MREIKKKIVYGNNGYKKECWIGLQKGDKLICNRTVRGLLDVGMSGMTIPFDSFVKGKEYKVSSLSNWGGTIVAYVLDEDGCSCWATTDLFTIVEDKFEKRVNTIKDLLE